MVTNPHAIAAEIALRELREHDPEALADERDAEQFSLFGEPQTEAGATRWLTKRRPGRPPGSLNKRSHRTVQFLLSRHRDPREVLLEIAEAHVADLASAMGMTMAEALTEKRLAAIGVLPYLAHRMPIEIDVSQKSVVYLTINEGHAGAPAAEPFELGGAVEVFGRHHVVELEPEPAPPEPDEPAPDEPLWPWSDPNSE